MIFELFCSIFRGLVLFVKVSIENWVEIANRLTWKQVFTEKVSKSHFVSQSRKTKTSRNFLFSSTSIFKLMILCYNELNFFPQASRSQSKTLQSYKKIGLKKWFCSLRRNFDISKMPKNCRYFGHFPIFQLTILGYCGLYFFLQGFNPKDSVFGRLFDMKLTDMFVALESW